MCAARLGCTKNRRVQAEKKRGVKPLVKFVLDPSNQEMGCNGRRMTEAGRKPGGNASADFNSSYKKTGEGGRARVQGPTPNLPQLLARDVAGCTQPLGFWDFLADARSALIDSAPDWTWIIKSATLSVIAGSKLGNKTVLFSLSANSDLVL